MSLLLHKIVNIMCERSHSYDVGSSQGRNIVIITGRSGRHCSVVNAELWSNTLTRCSRHEHYVSLCICLRWISEKTRVQGTVRSAANSVAEFFKHYDRVRAECFDVFFCPIQWQAVGSGHDQSTRKVPHDSIKRKITFRKLRKKTRDQCHSHICRDDHESRNPGRTGTKTREAFTTAPVHWPVVCRNTTSPVRQIRV